MTQANTHADTSTSAPSTPGRPISPIPSPSSSGQSPSQLALLYGLGAVLIWGGYMALARAGVSQGLTGFDFAFIRSVVAGPIMLPWLLRHQPLQLAGIGLLKGLALVLFAGPVFIAVGVGGYAYAPLAHGAVVQPATIVVASSLLAWWLLKERPPRTRVLGIGLIVLGLCLISGPSLLKGDVHTLLGDAMFVAAGLLWAMFTVLNRRWLLPAVPTTAVLAVLSAVIVVPIYVATQDFSRLAALPTSTLLVQFVVQGLLSGVVAIIFFTRAAELIGAARAAVFPALVPGASIIIGIPVTGELPTPTQWAGLAVVTIGLMTAIGLLARLRRR